MMIFRSSILKGMLSVLAAGLMAGVVWSAVPEVTVGKATKPIKLDGKISSREWKNAARVQLSHYTTGAPVSNLTEALLMCDGKNLYIGFICQESQMDKVKDGLRNTNGAIFSDDVVELMLAPESHPVAPNYYQLAVTIAGIWYVRDMKDEYHFPDYDVKTSRQKKSWTAEFVLPLKNFMDKSKAGQDWRINLMREEQPSQELSSWSKSTGAFHDVSIFGVVKGIKLNE